MKKYLLLILIAFSSLANSQTDSAQESIVGTYSTVTNYLLPSYEVQTKEECELIENSKWIKLYDRCQITYKDKILKVLMHEDGSYHLNVFTRKNYKECRFALNAYYYAHNKTLVAKNNGCTVEAFIYGDQAAISSGPGCEQFCENDASLDVHGLTKE